MGRKHAMKNSLKRICIIIAVTFSTLVFITGCEAGDVQKKEQLKDDMQERNSQKDAPGQEAKAKPKIRIAHTWNSETGSDRKLSDEFKKFTGTNLELAEYSFEAERGDSLRDKIKIDLAANNLPDIFYYWALTSLKPMYDEGLILDVNDYFNASKMVKAENFVKYALDAYSPDGKNIYAVPITGSMDFLACNRELFKKFGLQYPKTYRELLAVSKVFADHGIIPLAVGSKGGNPAHFLFAEIYYQFGTLEYMNKVTTGENKFDCDLNRKTANLILNMARNRVFPGDPIANGYFAQSVSLYNEEKAAMVLGQFWSIHNFADGIVEKTDLITFPRFEGAVNDPATFCVGGVNNGWVINKASFNDPAKQEAIVKAMDFLVSDEIMSLLAVRGEFVMKDVKVDPMELSPLYTRVLKFTEKQKPLTNFWILMPDPVSQEVLSICMDELWAQSITAEDFCTKIQEAVDKAIKN